jgi:hypothetical protein
MQEKLEKKIIFNRKLEKETVSENTMYTLFNVCHM